MIIFAFLERRQRRAVYLDERSAQCLGGGAVIYAFEPRNRGFAAIADVDEASLGASNDQFFVLGEADSAFAEQFEPHLALDPVRPGVRGVRDPALAAIA